jgi:uncharacterized repeat protein (TIGR03803 family)/VCBS repeat-containing protein
MRITMHSLPELTSLPTAVHKKGSRVSRGSWHVRLAIVLAVFSVPSAAHAQAAYEVVAALDAQGSNGAKPLAGLIQASDGSFYGTSSYGASGFGTVFKMDAAGRLTTLHSFTSIDGAFPSAGLIQATDGSFYGTTSYGGASGYGTVFKMDAAGLLTLHSFSLHDGAWPRAGLIQASDGSFYGTTSSGGASRHGTVFKITAAGTHTTLHSFSDSDGSSPHAGLIQASDRSLYGTTLVGGASGFGTVFKLDAAETLTTLHHFNDTDGAYPQAGLIQASDGSFYGTTSSGGESGNGTVFTIGMAGTLATLHRFSYGDGANPRAGLIQASDGSFYGTTSAGGNGGFGTVFKLETAPIPAGTLTTLHNFNGTDGAYPQAGLIQANDGRFCGTTSEGGPNSTGTGVVFRVTLNTAPVATDDSYSMSEDSVLMVGWPGVLANDSDADGNTLAAVTVTRPTHGALTLSPNGSFTYTPSPDHNGPDSFTYEAEDGAGDSSVATVSVTVTSVNDAPVAQNGTASTTAGTPVSGTLVASDVDGNQLTSAIVTNGAKGTATITNASTGSFIYTPNTGTTGTDTFTFRANDGTVNSNAATITVTIITAPPPVAPSNLTATVQYSGTGKNKALQGVKLTWVDNSSNETVFRIQRCQVTGKVNALACTYPSTVDVTVPKDSITWLDSATSLTRSATYRYHVRSENAAGSSGWVEVQVTVQ